MLIEEMQWAPNAYHYLFQHGSNGDAARDGAVEYLKRQGCTRVIHAPGCSYGIVEPIAVVRQREMEPKYE